MVTLTSHNDCLAVEQVHNYQGCEGDDDDCVDCIHDSRSCWSPLYHNGFPLSTLATPLGVVPVVEPRRPVAHVILEFRFRLLRVKHSRSGSATLLTRAVVVLSDHDNVPVAHLHRDDAVRVSRASSWFVVVFVLAHLVASLLVSVINFVLPLYYTRNRNWPSAFHKSLSVKELCQNCHFGNGHILPILPFSGCIIIEQIYVSRCHVTSSGFQLSFRINRSRCVFWHVALCHTTCGTVILAD